MDQYQQRKPQVVLDDLEIRYLLHVPKAKCFIVSTQNKSSGRLDLFLLFDNGRRVYQRYGLRGTWEPQSAGMAVYLSHLVDAAVQKGGVPVYSAGSLAGLI